MTASPALSRASPKEQSFPDGANTEEERGIPWCCVGQTVQCLPDVEAGRVAATFARFGRLPLTVAAVREGLQVCGQLRTTVAQLLLVERV